jgi:hypothetical protein
MKTGTSFRVNLRDCEQNSLLTEAFSNPRMLHREQDYIANNSHFAVATVPSDIGSRLEDQKVIVIRRVLNKEKIAWLLVMILVMSPCVGTIAGMCSHRSDVGLAVGAGVFALASFLQGLAGWF